MRLSRFSKRDIHLHFRNNGGYYLAFLLAIITGIILAVVILISNDAYLGLVVSKNKLIYAFINGTASKGSVFFDVLIKFGLPLLTVFILGFNYYFALLSFIVVTYQFSILMLTISAIIKLYYVSGVLVSIFLIIPINLVFFANLIFFSVVCIHRSKSALSQNFFSYGLNKEFFIKLSICFCVILFLAFFVAFLLPILLKSAIFIIY